MTVGSTPDGALRCAICGTELRAAAKFCDSCGSPRSTDPPAPDLRSYTPAGFANRMIAGAREQAGERKQVTVLFADVSGSMELSERVEAEGWHRILDRFFSILCAGVQRYEGTISQFTGDGIMALFGAPLAHEDHARRACHAALHLIDELRRYEAELGRERGIALPVRIGLNSGEVVLGRIGDDLNVEYTALGHSVGLAKRMESLARPGTVYLTDRTAALVSGYFELEEVGPLRVKGAGEPIGVWRLAGAGQAVTPLDVARARGLSRLTDRDRELAILESTLERALEGDGQAVGIVAEPGVGKSRLGFEFADRCRLRGLSVHRAHALPYSRAVALLPVLEMLRGFFGIADRDAATPARERIARTLGGLDDDFSDDMQLLFELLGVDEQQGDGATIDPEARQRRLLLLVQRLIRSQAQRAPTLLVVEDLHWLDAASGLFFDALVDAVAGSRTMLLATYRPEYEADWLGSPHCHEVRLEPLDSDASAALVRSLLGADSSLEQLRRLIGHRAAGNPFFIEEAVRDLAEAGRLASSHGGFRLEGPADDLAIPASVQALLAARIDRLEDREKATLQAASVAGKRSFNAAVLARVANAAEIELDASLEALIDAGFIVADDEAAGGYAFKHPLTQEVAYGSLLGASRRSLHSAVAEAIAGLHPSRLDEQASLLAYHYEHSGETAEAARWHARAAEWAGINDQQEAIRHWRRVRELAGELAESPRAAGLARMADVWLLDLGWRTGMPAEEADRVLAEGRALAERTGSRSGLSYLLLPYGMIRAQLGHLDEFLELRAEAQQLADEAGDRGARLTSRAGLMYASLLTGGLEEALATAGEAIELVGGDPSVGVGGGSRSFSAVGFFAQFRGFLLGLTGHLDEGDRVLAEGLAVARERGELELIAWGRVLQIWSTRCSGRVGAVLDGAEEVVEVADRVGGAFTRTTAHLALGMAQLGRERWSAAAEALERALAIAEEGRAGSEYAPWMLSCLGEALHGNGDPQGGYEKARAGAELAASRGLPLFELQARLALGRIGIETGEHQAARAELDRSLELAAATGARSFEPLVRRELSRLADPDPV